MKTELITEDLIPDYIPNYSVDSTNPDSPAVLLRHEFLRRDGFAITELQQGHRGRLLTRAPINRRRMVAIEFGM